MHTTKKLVTQRCGGEICPADRTLTVETHGRHEEIRHHHWPVSLAWARLQIKLRSGWPGALVLAVIFKCVCVCVCKLFGKKHKCHLKCLHYPEGCLQDHRCYLKRANNRGFNQCSAAQNRTCLKNFLLVFIDIHPRRQRDPCSRSERS